ncbi:MAG: hypothetical protein HKN26_05795 [Acidimicrobiales bacterium]|nr:hypothetical protein [Acidimicrobiales bacterium]
MRWFPDIQARGRFRGRGAARLFVVAAVLATATATTTQPAGSQNDGGTFRLEILSFGSLQSALVGSAFSGPGADRFVGATRQAYEEADAQGGVILVGAGDYIAASPTLSASFEHPGRFHDARVLSRLPIAALAIGDNDLAFGPDRFADFVTGFDRRPNPAPFLATNLDVTGEARLAELAAEGRVAPSTVVSVDGRSIGIVAALPADVAETARLRGATVDADVVGATQSAIDALTESGVDIIVVLSHQGDVAADRRLVNQLSNADAAVLGGELAEPAELDLGIPPPESFGGTGIVIDQDGLFVPVVRAAGRFTQLGRLVLELEDGIVASLIESETLMVDQDRPIDLWTQRRVVEAVEAELERDRTDQVAVSRVPLNGIRSSMRSFETNLADLVADAVATYVAAEAERGGDEPVPVTLLAASTISSDAIIPAGPISTADLFGIAGSGGAIVVVELERDELKRVLESSVASVEDIGGRFPVLAGATLQVNLDAEPFAVSLLEPAPGARVRFFSLDDGEVLIADGEVVAGPPLRVAMTDRLVGTADGFPIVDARPEAWGATVQQALAQFVAGDLEGAITPDAYPESGAGRVDLG